MKTHFFFFLAGLMLLASCERFDGPTSAAGQVVDRHTGQPVGGATVQLVGVASGLGAGGTSPGNRFAADAQGRFSFSFSADAKQNYTLFASTPSGYASDFDAPLLKGGHDNTGLLIKASAPAWIRFNCVDDLPASRIGLTTYGYNGSGDNQNVGPGNFSFVRPTAAYSSHTISCTIIDEQGKSRLIQQLLTVANFDTATVTIHF